MGGTINRGTPPFHISTQCDPSFYRAVRLTLSTRASQSSDEDAVWARLGLALPPASRRSSRCEVGWPHEVVAVLVAGWALRPSSIARTSGRTKSSNAKVIAGPR